jgi:hypothetical protein
MPTTVPRREDLCKKYHFACSSRTEGVQRFIAAPMSCKSWDCPACRTEKARRYKKRMGRLWTAPKLFFLTLTYFHDKTPDQAWSTYNAAWNRLRTNLSKQFGSFNYVRILESHNNSPYPHLHLITDRRFPAHKFGPAAIAAGFGYQIKQVPITSYGAQYYITKYLTKEWKNEEGWHLRKKYRCRVISFSRGLMSPENAGGNWNSLLVGASISECIERIHTEIQWNTSHRMTIRTEKLDDGFYEAVVDIDDAPLEPKIRCLDDWEPEDWVPR